MTKLLVLTKIKAGWNKGTQLIQCLQTLGWSLGWKYWLVQNKCALNPEIALSWAQTCEEQAFIIELKGEELTAHQYRAWAKELRDCYARFMVSTEKQESVIEPTTANI